MGWLIAAASAFGLIVVAIFILHVMASSIMLRHAVDPHRAEEDDIAAEFEWHVFVPALNEAAVIAGTVEHLLSFGGLHVWVIDDASTDSTFEIAESAGGGSNRLHIVRRTAPSAQNGKGNALNSAYDELVSWRSSRPDLKSDDHVLVGVVDADGRLSLNTFDALVTPDRFSNSAVGAVQQDVWIRAFDPSSARSAGGLSVAWSRLMIQLQDLEFRASIAAIQNFRHSSGSVSMGGNGQWTRLSALAAIARLDGARADVEAGRPWHGALLEDFELGVHLMLTGWETRFTPEAWVSQEGVSGLRQYLRQRTRWAQGSMQCLKYVPELWMSTRVGPWAMIETLYYLAQPWFWIIGTFLFPLPLIEAVRSFVVSPSRWMTWVTDDGGWLFLVLFWVVALGPLMSWGATYRVILARRGSNPDVGVPGEALDDGRLTSPMTRGRAMWLGFAYVWLVQMSFVIAWRALFRLLRGRNGWDKTARAGEVSIAGSIVSDIDPVGSLT